MSHIHNLRSHFAETAAKIRQNPRRIIPVVLALILLSVGIHYLVAYITYNGEFTVSGTIEATEVRLGPERGGRVEGVFVREGDRVLAGEEVVEVRGASGPRERITSPINGAVLYRSAEPGEVALAGSTLITVADLDALTLTVYVPEDRYGRIMLGQTCPVTVDSYPGRVFQGTVSHIADKAEFTPRNVQTSDSRKSTVFAIKLDLAASDGRLKPGMPADVRFPANHR